jgi:Tol biopolymer transport system component
LHDGGCRLIVDCFGSDQVNLTNSPGPDWYPDASPDGSRIVFQFEGEEETVDVFMTNGRVLDPEPGA